MRRTLAAACAVMLGLVSALYAQAPYSTWKRWPVTTPPPKSPAAPPQAAGQDRRLGEILVELELLADPVTFPYELEARGEKSTPTLHLCGAVPSKAVRDHALLVAQQRWHPV